MLCTGMLWTVWHMAIVISLILQLLEHIFYLPKRSFFGSELLASLPLILLVKVKYNLNRHICYADGCGVGGSFILYTLESYYQLLWFLRPYFRNALKPMNVEHSRYKFDRYGVKVIRCPVRHVTGKERADFWELVVKKRAGTCKKY